MSRGRPRSRYQRANLIAEALGVTADELRMAVIEAAEGVVPPSGILNIPVRIPLSDKPGKIREDSLLARTAKCLQVDPRDLQTAIIAVHPDVAPGKNVSFGVRVAEYVDDVATKMQYAEAAAAAGDEWAAEWLLLVRKVRKLMRDL